MTREEEQDKIIRALMVENDHARARVLELERALSQYLPKPAPQVARPGPAKAKAK